MSVLLTVRINGCESVESRQDSVPGGVSHLSKEFVYYESYLSMWCFGPFCSVFGVLFCLVPFVFFRLNTKTLCRSVACGSTL